MNKYPIIPQKSSKIQITYLGWYLTGNKCKHCTEESCSYEVDKRRHFQNFACAGTGTKFVAYLSSTISKHEMDIHWLIMKNKLTNDEYSFVFNVILDHISKEMLSFNVGGELR